MNKRGQFSIIAALLVAVVLIATVIITYSTIRNSPIQEHPQLLSAIDETNFAIKRILGFTVGYYGSVLKVTGDASYARTLAINYLHSGLVNIAKMHPAWGASFKVDTSQLQTNWFTNVSYSTGNIGIKYNLTGLGISGITYETSCRLTVRVMETTSLNESELMITTDEEEPLVNLGRSNFKFYRYNYDESSWELVSPSTEPLALANGTYILEVPTGVDPHAYLIQVEDPRGLIAVASSFSHYSCTLTWNSRDLTRYAITGSIPQTAGPPDGVYGVVPKAGTCYVTAFQGGTGAIKQVYFNITYYGSVSGTVAWGYQLDSGGWITIGDLEEGGTASSPMTATYNATALRPTWTWSNINATDIQFQNNDIGGSEDAYIDSMYVTIVVENPATYSSLRDATLVGELLQNGTMRWLGQNLELTSVAKPIPPIPVRALRVNQTINSIAIEVPFQVEDWASNYMIPMGLTSNVSLFSNRAMLVFLVNPNASKVTIWWNGSDQAAQTSYAYTNRYFTGDDLSLGRLTNGIMSLEVISGFRIRSTLNNAQSTARFMRINSEWSVYGSDPSYAIHHGIVRDIIHQEAEWSTGAPNCPNFYAHIVLTLPANATYYTYQLRLIFVESQQDRTITDLCAVQVTASTGQPETEDGTVNGLPIISQLTGVYRNTSHEAHHFSQFASGGRGAGIMFTTNANQMLYVFDKIAGQKIGGLRVSNSSSRIVELAPVTTAQAAFKNALDVTWYGAVVTFDQTTPIYKEESGNKTGLWISVEYPPTVRVSTDS